MKISTENLISISDANKNFSKVVKLVDASGEVIILKNNKPKYIVSSFSEDDVVFTDKDKVELVARRILQKHKHAFEVLAK